MARLNLQIRRAFFCPIAKCHRRFTQAGGNPSDSNVFVTDDESRLNDSRPVQWVAPPAISSSTGAVGDMAYDGKFLYVYVCVATNSWLQFVGVVIFEWNCEKPVWIYPNRLFLFVAKGKGLMHSHVSRDGL